MMTFLEKVNQQFMPGLAKFANFKYIIAIRDGMISTIPLTIVGSFFLILAFPPVPTAWFETMSFFQWIAENRLSILIPFRASMGLIAIFVVYNTAFSLAEAYRLNGISSGTMSLVAFFITQEYPVATAGDRALGLVVPLMNLGSAGMFVGILTAFVCTEIYRFFKEKDLIIKMPPEVPTAVARSFEALIPMICIMVLFGLLHYGPKLFNPDAPYINLHTIIAKAFFWLSKGVDSLGGALLLVFFICLLWIAGIHGMAIIGAVARPIWLQLLDANSVAFAAGEAPVHIFSEPFYQWYVWIGGSGATIGLVLSALMFAKSPFLKSMSKMTIVPSLFNINEPVVFGLPIVMNPVLGIPFILAPMVMTVVTWAVISAGLVPPNVILAPWTFPAPIGAYLSSGGSWAAAVLSIVNILISIIIYTPFMLIYDKQMMKEPPVK